MYLKHKLGKTGEDIATQFLEKKGYTIVERNFQCRQGEIDIIARNLEYLIFIEVKTRTSKYFGRPSEAVNDEKQTHLYRSAKYYLYKNHIEEAFVRFDIVEVLYSKSDFKINHIKYAF